MARAAARLLAAVMLVCAWCAAAHDPSAWGGVYRSRDDGGNWLAVDADLFIGAALGIAVSPVDPNHLLYATDTRLLRSRNGGRDWVHEAADKIHMPTLAATFGTDGRTMLATTASGIFRGRDAEPWQSVDAPAGAVPARFVSALGEPGWFLLAGRTGLFRSENDGRTWTRSGQGLPDAPLTGLTRIVGPPERLFAIADGSAWTSNDGGKTWHSAGLPDGRAETVSSDHAGGAVWAFAADQLHRSDDGTTWRAIGQAVTPSGTSVRGLAVADGGRIVALATHRGLLRSADGGNTWSQVEGALPTTLEAGFLLRDPHDAGTLYVGFGLTPYAELWRVAPRSGGLLGDLRPAAIAAAVAAVVLIGAAAVFGKRRLRRART